MGYRFEAFENKNVKTVFTEPVIALGRKKLNVMDAAAFVQKQAEKRIADQKALFECCIPQEVEYLDHAYAARGKPSHPVRLFR